MLFAEKQLGFESKESNTLIFEADFFYNGIERWSLGWSTPNYASAFFVAIVCLLWCVQSNRFLQLVSLIFEIVLYLIIIKTYSRGGLVALFVCAGLFVGLMGTEHLKSYGRIWLVRIIYLLSLGVGFGFFGRLDPNYISSDASVINRLSLWKSSLEMISASPFHGWGAGDSGRSYMNWFQELDRIEVYATTVNTYLQIGVEYGFPLLIVVLIALFSIVLITWHLARLGDSIACASGVSVVSWAIANIFTTLWIEPKLWLVPGLAFSILSWRICVYNNILKNRYSRIVFLSITATSASILSMYIAGLALGNQSEWRITPGDNNVTRLEFKGKRRDGNHTNWHMWSDPAVLGRLPGKEVRRWAAEYTEPDIYLYSDTPSRGYSLLSPDSNVLLIGKHSVRMTEILTKGCLSLWLIHPTGVPAILPTSSSKSNCVASLLLPAIDETGLNALWMLWAKKMGVQVYLSPNMGIDIRSDWPKIVLGKL